MWESAQRIVTGVVLIVLFALTALILFLAFVG